DVVDLPRGLGGGHEARERAHGVGDVTETARLLTVAVDLERRAGEGALDEAGDDHPVLAALARADRVEEAGDDAVEAALLVVGEGEQLVHRLRVGIGPAPGGGGAVDAAGILGQGLERAVVAVDLRGGGEENALLEAVAV